jgi:hypothetical protein
MGINSLTIRKKKSRTRKLYYYVIYSATLAGKQHTIHWVIGYKPKSNNEAPMSFDKLAKLTQSLPPNKYIHFAYRTGKISDKGLVFTCTAKYPPAFALAMIKIAQEVALRCKQTTISEAQNLAGRFFHAFRDVLRDDGAALTALAEFFEFTDDSLFGGHKCGK